MSKLDIGAVKSLKIDVLTETGWFDNARFKQNMADYEAPRKPSTASPGIRRMQAATRRY